MNDEQRDEAIQRLINWRYGTVPLDVANVSYCAGNKAFAEDVITALDELQRRREAERGRVESWMDEDGLHVRVPLQANKRPVLEEGTWVELTKAERGTQPVAKTGTRDQIANVMLREGSPEQIAEALLYTSNALYTAPPAPDAERYGERTITCPSCRCVWHESAPDADRQLRQAVTAALAWMDLGEFTAAWRVLRAGLVNAGGTVAPDADRLDADRYRQLRQYRVRVEDPDTNDGGQLFVAVGVALDELLDAARGAGKDAECVHDWIGDQGLNIRCTKCGAKP